MRKFASNNSYSNAIEGNSLTLRDARIRYVHALDEANTGNYNLLANIIGQAVEAGLDLYLEACASSPEIAYQSLSALEQISGYSVDNLPLFWTKFRYLGWLVHNGRIDAVKRVRLWYSTKAAIEQYKAEVDEGKMKRGRPKNKT